MKGVSSIGAMEVKTTKKCVKRILMIAMSVNGANSKYLWTILQLHDSQSSLHQPDKVH